MRDRELTDDQWIALAPHLPAQRAATGRPAKDHRTIVAGILWRLRTGAPWRDLPERYGPWPSVYTRFRRWQTAGVWDRALAALQTEADARGDLDWSLHFVDGTVIRAHPHAAGAAGGVPRRVIPSSRPPARGGGQKGGGDRARGRSQGGWGTKLHLRTDRAGKPITWILTPGQRHEATQLEALLERGAVARPTGQSRVRPARVGGDKGDTGRRIRTSLRRRGIGAVIPRQTRESRRGVRFDRDAYRERNAINRLKQHRAIATRYEKLEETFHALLTLAAILRWLPV